MGKGRIFTGEIIPRDYGVRIALPNGRAMFASPSKYAIATVMLETPREIRQRLREHAESHGVPIGELQAAFAQGVETTEGSKRTLNVSGRNTLSKVRRYANTHTAHVGSRHDESSRELQLTRLDGQTAETFNNLHALCTCQDYHWNKLKNDKNTDTMCVHLATLEIALYQDIASRATTANSITNLPPRERAPSAIPFFHGAERDSRTALTDIIVAHYVEGKTHYDINSKALRDPRIYTPALLDALSETARFAIIRQDERSVDPASLAASERRLHSSTRMLLRRMEDALKRRGFEWEGYAREFVGTPFACVARRWRGSSIYHLCVVDDAPLVVRRQPGDVRDAWYDDSDGSTLSPWQRHEAYESLDDAERTTCKTQVLIPGATAKTTLHVPQNLLKHYRKLAGKV